VFGVCRVCCFATGGACPLVHLGRLFDISKNGRVGRFAVIAISCSLALGLLVELGHRARVGKAFVDYGSWARYESLSAGVTLAWRVSAFVIL